MSTTLIVTYDYVASRTAWRVVGLHQVQADGSHTAMPLPWQRERRYFDSLSAMERFWTAQAPQVQLVRLDPCTKEQHDLKAARCSTASASGELVYVVCACGRQRQVSAAQWQAVRGEG